MQLRRESDSNKDKFVAQIRRRRRMRILRTRAAIKEASLLSATARDARVRRSLGPRGAIERFPFAIYYRVLAPPA